MEHLSGLPRVFFGNRRLCDVFVLIIPIAAVGVISIGSGRRWQAGATAAN